MRAEVRSVEANDLPRWPDWSPASDADELQWFTVSVGPEGEPGSDLFQVAVATPRGIRARRRKTKFVGLVVERFEPPLVERAIREFVSGVQEATWDELARRLGRTMPWEFDGYKG